MIRSRRICATFLALIMLLDILCPTVLLALTSGPKQPEMKTFSPAASSEMVDLFSGDFSYNIPLLDVEGYPVNLFYQGGVTMDQEASWVGLGWNVNAGSVSRNLRGIPDDFAGDLITRNMGLRSNRTLGVNLALGGIELFGDSSIVSLGLNAGVSPSFNNQRGISMDLSVGVSLSANLGGKSTKFGKSAFTSGLSLNSGSNSGLRLQPTVGIETTQDDVVKGKNIRSKAGLNIGVAIDSRKGLSDITLGSYASASSIEAKEVPKKVDGEPVLDANNEAVLETVTIVHPASTVAASTSFDMGIPTYTPQINMPMSNLSVTVDLTLGSGLMGIHANGRAGASFSVQKLASPTHSSPAFGYLNLEKGQNGGDVILDFNREKGGPYSSDQAALGISALTPDIFSVSCQSISGSFRPFRSEVGHVHDASISSGGGGGSFGVELGLGAYGHGGGQAIQNFASSWSGRWNLMNGLTGRAKFRRNSTDSDRENVFFREANEMTVESDSSLYTWFGRDEPLRFALGPTSAYNASVSSSLETTMGDVRSVIPDQAQRNAREPRSKLFTYLSHGHIQNGFGMLPAAEHGFPIPAHHMSEITVLDEVGGRYVFGLPAYNIAQHDVTFSVNSTPEESNGHNALISYEEGDDSDQNEKGIDHYFSDSHTPPYAHSFLLTAIVSPDYSDIDGTPGPSDGDLGTYTRFHYTRKQTPMPWRTPVGTNLASFNRGLGATREDDKASYVYGEKENYHLERIETQNRIAVFELNDPEEEPRHDALGVNRNGSPTASQRSRYLKAIRLYPKQAYLAHQAAPNEVAMPDPIKTVHFAYTYQLCPGTPNSVAEGGGKLTLTQVWFTYGSSNRGRTNAYHFQYDINPAFDFGAVDRWGNFKENGTTHFPYSEQENRAVADANAAAWNLSAVWLPSGAGFIVEYEADDYGYVQDRQAMRMVPVEYIGDNTHALSDELAQNSTRLYFRIPADLVDCVVVPEDVRKLLNGNDLVYFRSRLRFNWQRSGKPSGWDDVSGYAAVDRSADQPTFGIHDVNGVPHGWIELTQVDLDEDCSDCPTVTPIYRTAIEHARLNYPAQLFSSSATEFDDGMTVAEIGYDFIDNFVGALTGFLSGMVEFFYGPNEDIVIGAFPKLGTLEFESGSTYIKLLDPKFKKVGGGNRVRRISSEASSYVPSHIGHHATTMEYDYSLADGSSTGVAAYEPMIGGDENPFRRPVYYSPERLFAADERFYQEEPFGESLFPAPRVGYSSVTVRQIPYDEPSTMRTGSVVHHFYTAKDFPTRVSRTGIREVVGRSPGLVGQVGLTTYDHMHTTQGFVVETNDIHGKPKATYVYPEPSGNGPTDPISSVEYIYKTGEGGSKLRNVATVVHSDGTSELSTIGRNYEFLVDMREFGSITSSGGLNLNLELLQIFGIPVPIPPILPTYSMESTRFRSVVLVKKIERSGLLDHVVRTDHGAVVETHNLAYDARTGQVLLARENNEFNDPVYRLSLPAYWAYDGMGPASENIGLLRTLNLTGGVALVQNASKLYVAGDELSIQPTSGAPDRAWVLRVEPDRIHVTDINGAPINGNYASQVIRSGRRNMQGALMESIISKADPLQALRTAFYPQVLRASATEYSDSWRTDCGCFNSAAGPHRNPYRENRKGVWRLAKERAWLSERTRSTANGTTNIRHDGVLTSYSPLNRIVNNTWSRDPRGWTVVREVTEYSSRSQELEEKDALGLYSAATFSHGGTLPSSVTRNAQHQEVGFESFESPFGCSDGHFRFNSGAFEITDKASHSGRHSLKVVQGTEAKMVADLRTCEPRICGLTLTSSPDTAGSVDITMTGGDGPFTIDREEILGGSFIQLTNAGMIVTPTTTGDWQARISVMDANGCTTTLLVP